MKDFLCPKKSSLKDDSNGTKNETDKRILWFFMIGQSFVKSIGVFPGPWSILLKKHPVLKELIWNTIRSDRTCLLGRKDRVTFPLALILLPMLIASGPDGGRLIVGWAAWYGLE